MTDELPEIAYRDATLTCHTDGCGNAGVAIEMQIEDVPEPAAVCGACGQPITDIK